MSGIKMRYVPLPPFAYSPLPHPPTRYSHVSPTSRLGEAPNPHPLPISSETILSSESGRLFGHLKGLGEKRVIVSTLSDSSCFYGASTWTVTRNNPAYYCVPSGSNIACSSQPLRCPDVKWQTKPDCGKDWIKWLPLQFTSGMLLSRCQEVAHQDLLSCCPPNDPNKAVNQRHNPSEFGGIHQRREDVFVGHFSSILLAFYTSRTFSIQKSIVKFGLGSLSVTHEAGR